MYRLIKAIPFQWSFVRDNATVNPHFDIDLKNKIRVHFLSLEDTDGNCYGIWTYDAISRDTLSNICRIIQAAERDWEYLDPVQTAGFTFDN